MKRKTLLITGDTGSFGNAVLKRYLKPILKKSAFSDATRKSKTICGNYTMTLKLNESKADSISMPTYFAVTVIWMGMAYSTFNQKRQNFVQPTVNTSL
jgi:FlaA1/EpsC-like NDP-sugar epimerase